MVHPQDKTNTKHNERLEQEQTIYLKNLLKQAKDFEQKLSDEKDVDKNEVIQVMMDKWEAAKVEEKELAALKEQMARREADIIQEQKEVGNWRLYKVHGRHEHQKQIALLEQELLDMETSFTEMTGHLERSLGKAMSEITEHTEETLDKQKYLATEKAMAKLDKNSRQEVLDNDWLKKEVEMHKKEVIELLKEVEKIERSNLQIMSELFECTVDDLKISRSFYLTQFGDDDNLEEAGVLEMDLAKTTLPSNEHRAIFTEDDRPQSVMDVIAEKVLALGGPLPEANEHIDSDETDESDYGEESVDNSKDPFEQFCQLENEEYEDFLQLGPLELKLLNVTGKRMPIYRIGERSAEDKKAESYKPTDWPVTNPMLKDAMSPRTT